MERTLDNKVVVVTGASKGIGAGIAKKMAVAGAKVIVNFSSDKAFAEAIVDEITKAGGTAAAIRADMSKQVDVQRLFRETSILFGTLDILVNNAGTYEFALLEGFSEQSYKKIFDLNVLGTLLSCRHALDFFSKAGGSIINISSFASTRPEPYSVVYAASKGAVDSITYALSQELGPRNIRVNSVRPGGVFTEGVASLGATLESDAIQAMVKRSALGRMATPGDIGGMAVFLASGQSRSITGQTIEVSGGFR